VNERSFFLHTGQFTGALEKSVVYVECRPHMHQYAS